MSALAAAPSGEDDQPESRRRPPRLPEPVLRAGAEAAGVSDDVLSRAVELALAAGPDAAGVEWRQRARCRGWDAEQFYPSRGGQLRQVLAACASCPVQAECLGAALALGEHHGVWGGTSGAARSRLRRVLRSAGVLGVVGEDAYLAWHEDGADREPAPTRPSRLQSVVRPRQHQLEAVAAICAAIGTGGRCQVAMAPGSGKTHVGLWSAERLGATRVLVLVPSLPLVAQTIALWRHSGSGAARVLAVCSDAGELEAEATTDPGCVRAFLDGAGPAVVVATYQSSPVLAAAGARFDLAVADEAHHLAGARDKHFAALCRGEIPAERILYMTATPRQYRRRDGEVELVGMDDAAVFGPLVYRLSLSDAVAAGVVADYRIVVAAVEADTFARVATHPGLAGIDAHLLAGAIAVVRAMGDFGLASCLSFHTRVERARTFASLIGPVADALAGERPPGPGWSGWAHGGASVRIRQRLLARLADGASWGVLANARAFGEGVDLPTLDAVAIVDPKNSESDVLQAAGRALRRPGAAAKVGTVLLPVLLAEGGDATDPLAGIDRRGLEVVAGVLRALRAHDDDLGARLDRTRRVVGQASGGGRPDWAAYARSRSARGLLGSRVELWVPGGATGELAGALALRLVRESTPGWEEHLGRLRAWVDAHASAAVPQLATVPDGHGGTFGLGAWCTTQRTLRRRQLLAPERVAALEALPGWCWDPVPEQWQAHLDALADWSARHGDANCPQGTVWQGKRLGQWVSTVRTAYKASVLDAGRTAGLEALPGWSWDMRADAWEAHFVDLASWVNDHGHACPSDGDVVGGFDLGRWVAKQRSALRAGRLGDDRADRLRALPGWVDHEREAGWEAGFAHLRAWAGEHGHAAPPQSLVLADGYGLGGWVATQRERRRRGRLPAGREARLEALAGWEWSPRTDAWPAAYDRLVAFVEREGHARVPDRDDGSGFSLGAWVSFQRTQFARGLLGPERAAALERLPGWVWSVHDARFEAGVAALEVYVARSGNCEPGPGHREGQLRLGQWVQRVRALHGAGRLEAARAARLEAVDGWHWEAALSQDAVWAAAWEAAFVRLARWADANGHAMPRQHVVLDDGFRLGNWVAKQRARQRSGQLASDRAARLEQLAGWARRG